MTVERRIAVVRDYQQLHAALRARAHELRVSRETLDAISGLQGGYSGKLLAPVPIKALGRTSMGPMLGALGLMLVVTEDPEAMARIKGRLVKRERPPPILSGAEKKKIILKFSPSFMKKIARKSVIARMENLSPAKRSRIARRAVQARWKRYRQKQKARKNRKSSPPARSGRCVASRVRSGSFPA